MDRLAICIFAVSIPIAFASWRALGACLRAHFIRKMTVLHDIPNLGNPRANEDRLKGRVVICGGSIAGLWAARICADHFEEVVIIEPEVWLSTADGRAEIYNSKGDRIEDRKLHRRTRVPQYRAQHVFQPLALVALRKLFPFFDDEIIRVDGRIAKAEYNLQLFGNIIRSPDIVHPNSSYANCFFVTRETYELLLRRLVLAYSKRIRWITGIATGVTPDHSDPTVLNSVIFQTESGNEKTVTASLVIGVDLILLYPSLLTNGSLKDCTGISQAGFKWLRRIHCEPAYASLLMQHEQAPRGTLGFDGNLKIEYNTMQRYRKFRIFIPPDIRSNLSIPNGYDNAAWLFTYMPRPGLERKLFMVERVEGHRIEWAFGGWGDVSLPEEFYDVKDWLRNMETDKPIPSWIFKLLDELLEIDDDHETEVGRYLNNTWIRYERSPYVPSNFVAIGDAVMSANPTFGQGCSKAAIGAITLDGLLRKLKDLNTTSIPSGFGRRFFQVHSSRISGTWEGTKPVDYQWDTTTPVKGEKLSDERIHGRIIALTMQLAGTDDAVGSALFHVRTFLAPPTDLLHPAILSKILLLFIRQRLGWS